MTGDPRSPEVIRRTDAVALTVRYFTDVAREPLFAKGKDVIIHERVAPSPHEFLLMADLIDRYIFDGTIPDSATTVVSPTVETQS